MVRKEQTPAQLARQEQKRRALDAIAEAREIGDIAKKVGMSRRGIEGWRRTDAVFTEQFDRMWKARKIEIKNLDFDKYLFDPGRKKPKKPRFTQWRMKYTGRPVAPHQEGFVAAYEDQTNQTVIWFAPTGAGKDTTAGDMALYEICDNWNLRVAWLMENADFASRRVSERIEPYLTDPAVYQVAPFGPGTKKPQASLIEDYGPFNWSSGLSYPNGELVKKNTWTNQKLYFVREEGESEADPNLWASGLGGATYGARIQRLFVSDPFTFENQGSPTERSKQRALLEPGGTIATRLDGSGRKVIIGTRVAEWDNYGHWLEEWTKNARVISEQQFWGTTYQKFSNGVAVVITKAIFYGTEGEELSFWPDNPEFPLESYLEVDGKRRDLVDMTDDEILKWAELGAKRVTGLKEKRNDNPDRFEATQNQNPRRDEFVLDFSKQLLDHCDDPTRTIGQWFPQKEELILGVDPAQAGGAAWFVWAMDRETGVATMVDSFYGEKLGSQGIREKLVSTPINKYLPRYLCFEVNRESGQLEHPDVADLIRRTATELVRHHTHHNRSQGEASVSAMAFDMRDGMVRFPAFTGEDRSQTALVKQHFQNFDAAVVSERQNIAGKFGSSPDDLCLAAWIGWYHIKKLRQNMKRRGNPIRRRVPADVAANWSNNRRVVTEGKPDTLPLDDDRDVNNLMEWIGAPNAH